MNRFPPRNALLSGILRGCLVAGGVGLTLYLCSLAAVATVPQTDAADLIPPPDGGAEYQPWAPTFAPAPQRSAVALTPLPVLDDIRVMGPEAPGETNTPSSMFGALPGPVATGPGAGVPDAPLGLPPVSTPLPPPTDAAAPEAPPTEAPPSAPTHTLVPTSLPGPTLVPTDAPPPPTEAPPPTDEPKPTKEPKPTDEPKPTKEPKPTDEPKPTKEPKP